MQEIVEREMVFDMDWALLFVVREEAEDWNRITDGDVIG